MFEKVNPGHPDKVADRIAGAIVDLAYANSDGGFVSANPRIAVEVQLGHGKCNTFIETSLIRSELKCSDVDEIVSRIAGEGVESNVLITDQDLHLASNQRSGLRCGDNGIFRGTPITEEQRLLTAIARTLYANFPTDGKYVIRDSIGGKELIVCQSCAEEQEIINLLDAFDKKNYYDKGLPSAIDEWHINPLGSWTGGINVDTGAVNRKLGSDMGDGMTGGGLHGKDLSKGDVSINIVCFLLANKAGMRVDASCAIGDANVRFVYENGKVEDIAFNEVVEKARLWLLTNFGGSFERFAEWGLIF